MMLYSDLGLGIGLKFYELRDQAIILKTTCRLLICFGKVTEKSKKKIVPNLAGYC